MEAQNQNLVVIHNPEGKPFVFYKQPTEQTRVLSKLGKHRVIWVANDTMDFWRSQAKVKALFGGNRSGKTEAVVIEVCWWLMGEHPFRVIPPPPLFVRWVLPEYALVSMTLKEKFMRYLDPKALVGNSWEKAFDERFHQLRFKNGSLLEFKSYKVGALNLEGVALHLVVIDEECPYEVFKTLVMRTVDHDAPILISATPLKGLTWLWSEIRERGVKDPNTEFIYYNEIEMENNQALPKHSVEKVKQLISDVRRLKGEFWDRRVYPAFEESLITPVPEDGVYYAGFDWGYQHEAAFVVVKVSQGKVWVVDHLTLQYMSIDACMKEFRDWCKRRGYHIELLVYDSQLNAPDTNGEVPSHKVMRYFNALPATKKQEHSISIVNELMRQGILRFAPYTKENGFTTEIRKYCYKDNKKLPDKGDDLLDAFRYIVYWLAEMNYLDFSLQPQVNPSEDMEWEPTTAVDKIIFRRRQRLEQGNIPHPVIV